MDFQSLSKLASLLSKSFAKEFFRLLMTYKTISASEAASRLDLHIKTAQDFLEGLEAVGIVSKEEVVEKKRPYFRYTVIQEKIKMEFDLNRLIEKDKKTTDLDYIKIKEKKNANCVFKTSPKTGALATVIFYSGKGRDRQERKINLTSNQGKFLFYLPFPTEEPQSIQSLFLKSSIDKPFQKEVLDIVYYLSEHGIIEMHQAKKIV
jgi:predicted transcriptional regulator